MVVVKSVKTEDTAGTKITLAKDSTVSAGIKIKNSGGTVIDPALKGSQLMEIARTGTQIIKSSDSLAADTTLYTVPAGKTLYITSAWVTGINADSTEGIISTGIEVDDGTGVYVRLVGWKATNDDGTGDNDSFGMSNSFPIPVKVLAGDIVRLRYHKVGTATCPVDCGFTGWVE